jgi:hypothetical protein
MARRGAWALAVVIAVGGAAGSTAFVLLRHGSSNRNGSAQSFTKSDAQRLEHELTSSDPVLAGKAFTPQVRAALGDKAAGLVKNGLSVESQTFTNPAAGVATVEAHSTSGPSHSYLLMLEQDHGVWLLYATRDLP